VIDQFNPLLTLLLGWLLGLLGPAIVDRIKRTYRVTEITRAILNELDELQYNMALAAYLLCRRTDSLTDNWLDWMEPIIRSYHGPIANPGTPEAVRLIRTVPVKDRIKLVPREELSRGLSIKAYSVPLLTAHIAEISIFPVPFQAAVLRIKGQLDGYNQHLAYLQGQFDKTFTVSDPASHAALVSNMEKGYRELAAIARITGDLISKVPSRLNSDTAQ
jgi:hypothetical protein